MLYFYFGSFIDLFIVLLLGESLLYLFYSSLYNMSLSSAKALVQAFFCCLSAIYQTYFLWLISLIFSFFFAISFSIWFFLIFFQAIINFYLNINIFTDYISFLVLVLIFSLFGFSTRGSLLYFSNGKRPWNWNKNSITRSFSSAYFILIFFHCSFYKAFPFLPF